MSDIAYFKEQFEKLKAKSKSDSLVPLRELAFDDFSKMGIPTTRHEEWKYTRISSLFGQLQLSLNGNILADIKAADFFHLPGHEEANELVFINGKYTPALSVIRSASIVVLPLEEAAGNEQYKNIISANLGHSRNYLKDGINALNTAFVDEGVFVQVKKGAIAEHPVYLYNITDARQVNVLAQPRSLFHITEHAQVQLVETSQTVGAQDSFTNAVMEIVVEKDAVFEYYKIQNDGSNNSAVSTTHIRQVGKSYMHAVTVSLNGGIVRNNTNVIMEAANSEAHLYGLYFQQGNSHIDNHTIVDNVMPNCFSNELYKGMLDESSTGVFNGKIFVRQAAQKTNAFQSNKNVLLSDASSVNTKPQLEIFADDVKCSHGCTVGRLDDEGLFYLQSRGIPEKKARALLLHGFASDVLEKVKCEPIRQHIDELIAERLQFDVA